VAREIEQKIKGTRNKTEWNSVGGGTLLIRPDFPRTYGAILSTRIVLLEWRKEISVFIWISVIAVTYTA
jgi:hypothetical protein